MDEIIKKNLSKLDKLVTRDLQNVYKEIMESLKSKLNDEDLEKVLIKFYSVSTINNTLNHIRMNIGVPEDIKKTRNPEKSG